MASLKTYINFLEGFVNANRVTLLDEKLNLRTRYITIVLEDLFQPHNASAVVRSSDSFGIQDIHVIENRNRFMPNSEISLGSEFWTNITIHNNNNNNTAPALNLLRKNGYRLVATSLNSKSTPLEKFNLEKGKTALIFGTELTGISDTVTEMADEFVHIPMVGFAQSLNVSVCTAIIMHHLTWKLRQTSIKWQLSEEESENLKIKWLENSIKKPKILRKWFIENHGSIDNLYV